MNDGWYKLGGEGQGGKEVWYIENGEVFEGMTVADFEEMGFTFEPVMVMTLDQYGVALNMAYDRGVEAVAGEIPF